MGTTNGEMVSKGTVPKNRDRLVSTGSVLCGCKRSANLVLLQPSSTLTLGLSGVCALPLGVATEPSVYCFWDYFSSFRNL